MRAVILVSGGLDSATVLALARSRGLECHTLSLDYGQRHRAELAAAAHVSSALGAVAHRVVTLDYGQFGGSALTDIATAVPETRAAGIPVTYVPARNTVMLAIALGWAEVLEAREIHIGVNAVDYSGYPDCRPAFIAAFQNLVHRNPVHASRLEAAAHVALFPMHEFSHFFPRLSHFQCVHSEM